MEGFGGSVAGGGRYDKMIGKFTGMDTPACGFSIGFERIVTILLDAGFVVPSGKPANVRIVLTDDNGTATLYSGTQNGSVRLRQKVDYAGNAKVQFICDGKLISERNL